MSRSLFWSKFWIRTGLARLFPSVRKLVGTDTDALRYCSDRVLMAPVERMLDSALIPLLQGPQVIDLNRAAPRYETAMSLNRLTVDRLGLPHARGVMELRRAIADQSLRDEGLAVDPANEVLVTHGATGALTSALDAFVNPDERVVLFDPCSPLFAMAASSRQARVTWVPTWIEDGRCCFHPKALRQALCGARMLIFSDPANPTGATFAPDMLEQITALAAKFDVLIARDDTYSRFRYEGDSTTFETLPGAAKRTLTIGSGTSLGLASARVGWLRGPRGLINACSVITNLSAPFVPAVCQQLVARALRETDTQAFASVLGSFRERRQFAFDRLTAMGLAPTWPRGGYFLQANVPVGYSGRSFAEALYRDHQVLVGPGDLYSPRGRERIRISYAIEDGRLREGLARLAAFVKGEPATPLEANESFEAETPRVEYREEPRPAFSRA